MPAVTSVRGSGTPGISVPSVRRDPGWEWIAVNRFVDLAALRFVWSLCPYTWCPVGTLISGFGTGLADNVSGLAGSVPIPRRLPPTEDPSPAESASQCPRPVESPLSDPSPSWN